MLEALRTSCSFFYDVRHPVAGLHQYGVSPDPLNRKLLLTALAGRHCCIVPPSSCVLFPHTLICISERLAFYLLHSFFWYLFALRRDAKRTRQAHPLRVTVAEPRTFLAIF